ncbi:MAG: cytochrome c3 family protein [Phycisphaerales bacterium]
MNLFKTTLVTVVTMAGMGVSAANAQIANTAHNFSSYAWSGGEICKPCHTPHFANVAAGRLWNHTLTTATYSMHEGSGTAETNMDRKSRLCLSCHDGTVALDSFGGQEGVNFAPARVNLGTDLVNDHPIGSDAQYPPSPEPSFWAGAFRPESTFNSRIRLENWVDEGGVTHRVVSCTTCHNPHGRGFPYLLNISNAASAICLNCHIK